MARSPRVSPAAGLSNGGPAGLRRGGWSPAHPPGKRLAVRRSRELGRMPAFAACTPRELRRVARWGDLIRVEAGQVLVRRDRSDWWFFVVVSGRVALSDAAGAAGTLEPGSHFGAATIVGLRPQPVTATAAESSVLFVLGPRYLLSLLPMSAGFRRAVFPELAPGDYAAFAKRMLVEGQAEWSTFTVIRGAHDDVLPQTRKMTPGGLLALAPPRPGPQRDRMPGRPVSLAEAVHALAQLPPPPQPTPPPRRAPIRRRWWALTAAAAAGLGCALLFLYHPPRLVVTSGAPIDVAADVRVTGTTTYPPSGHYLLLWVRASQPDLAGYLAAWAEGRTTVAFDRGDATLERIAGRRQYLDSQRTAIRLALKAAGLDPRRVSVHIRDRGFAGPSAGLVYALTVEDLLTPGDPTHGRDVAVTGALLPDGSVAPIGWLSLKARGAVADRAALLLVPATQAAGGLGWVPTTCGVADLRDALRALADPAHDAHCVVAPSDTHAH